MTQDNVITLTGSTPPAAPKPAIADKAFHIAEPNDQPLARLQRLGAEALRTDELLALILRGGTRDEDALHLSARVLRETNGLGHLARTPYRQLAQMRGVTENKAATVLAALELGHRMVTSLPETRPFIQSPADAARLLASMGNEEQEIMRVLLLDTKNRVIAMPTVYRGSVHTTLIRTAELFREATRCNCVAIIIAHSHPSGDPTPSSVDIATTREIVQAGKILDIQVLDHLVIGSGQRFVSLKEKGLGFD